MGEKSLLLNELTVVILLSQEQDRSILSNPLGRNLTQNAQFSHLFVQ